MAEPNEQENRDGNEVNGRSSRENTSRRSMPDVNFDEMNFEQRRAPYNSGQRHLNERKYDKDREENKTGRMPNKP